MSEVASPVDCLVLGAGIVGVCTALHLQALGRSVVLVDRHGEAGLETSFGNAGLIERSSVVPYMFPREAGSILRAALNQSADVRYHFNALPQVLPWLARYFLASSPEGTARTARAALPLIERCLSAHRELMAAAGCGHLARDTGWIKLYRTQGALDRAAREAGQLAPHGLKIDVLGQAQLSSLEPALAGGIGGVHYRDPVAISDPAALSAAYARLFVARGGQLLAGDARSLRANSSGWTVQAGTGQIFARDAVVCLGPWSNDILRPLGYRIPLEIKRGYHMHFGTRGNAVLNHPVLDAERGYLLAPVQRGIRLTTGAEFARRNAGPTPVQLGMVEPVARALFPLAERLDATPWMGRRPCLPDMLPVIGPALRHKGLWLNFGHQHHGLTLAAVTGQLLAQMLAGAAPLCNPAPFSHARFG